MATETAVETTDRPARVGDPARLFRVKVVADSEAEDGSRLTTFRLLYPRVVLAEMNTHRVLSRSTESSRAIPGGVRRRQLVGGPYRPLDWRVRVAGMTAGGPLGLAEAVQASAIWDGAVQAAVAAADAMVGVGLAKEEANRLTEPFALVRTVVSGTRWDNFFALRTHGDCYPPFRLLARAMYLAYQASAPRRILPGGWHLPFMSPADVAAAHEYAGGRCYAEAGTVPGASINWGDFHAARWSAARCARVSYGRVDGTPTDPRHDDEMWAKLVGLAKDPGTAAWQAPGDLPAGPPRSLHASPLEHQATVRRIVAGRAPQGGNFGEPWVQFRKLFLTENVTHFRPAAGDVAAWAAEVPPEVFADTDPW